MNYQQIRRRYLSFIDYARSTGKCIALIPEWRTQLARIRKVHYKP